MDTDLDKKDIFIIGTGGFAKEVFFLIRETNLYKFKGFVDFSKEKYLTIGQNKYPIINEDIFLLNYKKSNIAFGVGRPYLLKKLSEIYKDFNNPNIIHPSFIGDKENIKMGKGNIITAGVIFTTDITIGSFNVFNLNMTIGHDANVGNLNVFNPSTCISGNTKIGNCNLFGVGSISLENLEIGNNNIIGAAALVTKNITDNGVYIGVPVKRISEVDK